MPLLDLVLSFTKKHNSVYNVFLESWLEIRENTHIKENLKNLYECLLYEQKNKLSFKCLDYLLTNNILHSLFKLTENMHKEEVYAFFEKFMLIAPECIKSDKNTIAVFNALFSKKEREGLSVALALCEGILEQPIILSHYIKDTHLLDLLVEYMFEKHTDGEYSRTALTYLLSLDNKEVIEYLLNKNILENTIKCINNSYIDLPIKSSNEAPLEFMLSLISFLCLIIRRIKRNKKEEINNQHKLYYLTNQIDIMHHKEPATQLMYWKAIIQTSSLAELTGTLIINALSSKYVKEYLCTTQKSINNLVLEFLKFLVKEHPFFALRFFNKRIESWSAEEFNEYFTKRIEIGEIEDTVKKLKETKNYIKKRILSEKDCCLVNCNVNVLFDDLLGSECIDAELLVYIFMFCKNLLFSNFKRIVEILEVKGLSGAILEIYLSVGCF